MSTPEQDLAARAVELLGRALPGSQAYAAADRHRLALTRFANSVIHQNVAQDGVTVSLTAHVDGRTAGGSASVVDDHELSALVERVAASARVAPSDPSWPGLAAPAAPGDVEAVDRATAEASPTDRAEIVREFVDAAGGLETAGYVRTNHWTGAFASSSGQQVTGEAVECGLSGIARDSGADGLARSAPLRIADLDGAALGARAAAKARAWADPQDLAPERYEVVLEPNAVLDLLGNIASAGFSARAVNENRSFVRLGEDQFDPAVSIHDDPLATGLGYDAEGTPRSRLALVEGGRTVSLTHDRRSAAEWNAGPGVGSEAASTGHHGEYAAMFGPSARHLVLDPAGPLDGVADEVDGPAADSSVAELVAGVRRGILVSDFWYTRVLDPRSLAITGLTRNGVWLIENGEIVQPLGNLRFTQAYAEALAPGNVLGVGRTADAVPGDTYTTTSPRWTCPALHLASWNFTGGSAG